MKSLIKVSLFLTFVCLISSTTLALTYDITLPIIKKNDIKKYKESLIKVIPGAVKFEDRNLKFEKTNKKGEKEIKDVKYSIGKDTNENFLGFATVVAPGGYAGPIEMMVGMDKDGKVNGIIIQNMNETPGLGTKVTDPKFKKQFIGLTSKVMPKVKQDKGTIDAITAATISSRSICVGVTEALTIYKNHKSEIFSNKVAEVVKTETELDIVSKKEADLDVAPKEEMDVPQMKKEIPETNETPIKNEGGKE